MAMPPKNLVKKIIKKNNLCVLATASLSGKPEAAIIEYAEDSQGNLYFETFPTYRKYSNLKMNPWVSAVITQLPHTVQMDGRVAELKGEQSERAKKALIAKNGPGSGFYSDPKIKFFKFKPSWIRVLINAKWPPKYVMVKGRGPRGLHTLH